MTSLEAGISLNTSGPGYKGDDEIFTRMFGLCDTLHSARSGYLAELWIGAETWFMAFRNTIPKNNEQSVDGIELPRSIWSTMEESDCKRESYEPRIQGLDCAHLKKGLISCRGPAQLNLKSTSAMTRRNLRPESSSGIVVEIA